MAVVALLRPGVNISPVINLCEIPVLLENYYGINVKNIKELNSYDDRNYFIEVEGEIKNQYITNVSPNGYVFKILNSHDSQWAAVVEGQNLMMQFLHSKGFHVPTPVRTRDGKYQTLESLPRCKEDQAKVVCPKHIIRLLEFVPGTHIMAAVLTQDFLYELGTFTGRLNNVLKGFVNEAIAKHVDMWQLPSVPNVLNFLYVIEEPQKRELIQSVVAAWNSVVVPLVPSLERGIIHGDLNEQNILVEKDEKDPFVYHIGGLLDFGGVSCSCYVFELAIAIAYMMMESRNMELDNVPGYILAGYLMQRTLSDNEWMVLKECTAARFAQSLVLGAYTFSLNPTNTYLLTTAKCWGKLETFWAMSKEELISRWKDIATGNRSGSRK